jgi:hypothetical protein
MILEHGLQCLEIEFGGQVHHGEILVIEGTVLVRRIAIALDEVVEHLPMGREMPVPIHGQEAAQLQESRIDPAPTTRMAWGDGMNAMAPEPRDVVFLGEGVDGRRGTAGVDRPTQEGCRPGHQGMILGFHQGDGGEHRHGRLADRHYVQIRSERLEYRDAVIDIIGEIECAVRERHVLGIAPVGDEHLMAVEEGCHRAPQQGGIVARHWRHDQQLGLVRRPKGDHPAEGPLPHHSLQGRKVEARFGIGAGGPLEQLARGRQGTAAGDIGQWAERVFTDRPCEVRHSPGRGHHQAGRIMQQVQHANNPRGPFPSPVV